MTFLIGQKSPFLSITGGKTVEQEYETIDLREIFFMLKNNLLAIVASTIVCAIVGFLVTNFLITPQYQASATMIVNSQRFWIR